MNGFSYWLGDANEKGTFLNNTGRHIRNGIRDAAHGVKNAFDPSYSNKEHDWKSGESGHKRGSAVDSATSASDAAAGKPDQLTEAYIQQNRIGIDDQPIDPEFHVFRPINMLAIATHPDMAAADIIEMSGGKYGQAQAWALIQAMITNSGGGTGSMLASCGPVISKSQYYQILRSISPYRANREVALSLATGKSSFPSTPNTPLGRLAPYQTALTDYMQNREYKYECRLFNFYADDSKYSSGQITLTGRIGMEFGKRVVWFDQRRRYAWEFYLTGVSHDFNYKNGWTTTITVERGLPFTFREAETYLTEANTGNTWLRDNETTVGADGELEPEIGTPIMGDFNKRFTSTMWGHAEPFIGGFFGEQTLASMLSQANARESAYMTKFTGGGSSSGSGSGDSSGSSADGTGSIKEKGIQNWKWSQLPSDIKKYAHDPSDCGMKYGSSSGWSDPGNQCVNFSCSYFHKIWHTSRGEVYGNGNDMADSWHRAISGSKESSTPHAGAVAGSTWSAVGGMHTWIVQHVLANGQTIIAEENFTEDGGHGGSGSDVGENCTWDIGIRPAHCPDTQYTTPGSKYHLSWS